MDVNIHTLQIPIAFVIVLSIVFVEDIDIFTNKYMYPVYVLIFMIVLLNTCNQYSTVGLLLITLFVLIFLRNYNE